MNEPTEQTGEYRFCGADLGTTEYPFTCNRRVAHAGRCSGSLDEPTTGPTPMSPERLAEYAALAAAATPGPWLSDADDGEVVTEHGVAVAEVALVADGELIAAAPELLAEVQRLREELVEERAHVEKLTRYHREDEAQHAALHEQLAAERRRSAELHDQLAAAVGVAGVMVWPDLITDADLDEHTAGGEDR